MENLITLSVAAKALNVAENTLRTWKRRGEIPASCFKKIGTRVYLKKDKFQDFVDN